MRAAAAAVAIERTNRDIPLNTHVEVIAGEHEGTIGYISDATKATAQVTTGDDEIFTVRKTSLRILAHPVDVTVAAPLRKVDVPRIINNIDHIANILTITNGGRAAITLGQWQEINTMICEMFE